ncbi:urease accessory protein UreD [Clostridium akagii]|uniref:urease accessory protein UreD n=1 Tax=Clostridium akagii TaxID=91623 RepID=UPI00068F7D3C|nr:urease accessory protein UreD [Clostridium akagii]
MGKGTLNLELKVKNGKTIIGDSYFTSPLKILKPFYNEDYTKMKLCILNVSAGILEGDQYHIKINLAKDSNIHSYSQAYTKIFKMRGGVATQKLSVNMEEGSNFSYMPMPTIPFVDSNFISGIDIRLKKHCKLILREIISCGRYKNNEVFEFLSFSSKTKVYLEDKLIFMDNTLLRPKEQELTGIGFYEKYNHQANMIIFSENISKNLKADLLKFLGEHENIEFGISESFTSGMIIRILGTSSEQLRKITDKVETISNGL